MDDCIDNIGQAKYVTKFDLSKGFWQIPLTDRAKEISAFVTPDGLYQYKVMPFGMKNSPATFQRLINMIITGLDNCKSRKENPQKLTQLSSRSHPRHLVGKRTAQKDTIIDITSDSQVNSNFPYRWSPASLTFNNYFYLFLYL